MKTSGAGMRSIISRYKAQRMVYVYLSALKLSDTNKKVCYYKSVALRSWHTTYVYGYC